MKALILALAIAAPAAADSYRLDQYLGIGGLPCTLGATGFGGAPAAEYRQWIFGYLSAIDDDVFKVGGQTEKARTTEQEAIFKMVDDFVRAYCGNHPRLTIGDALATIKFSYLIGKDETTNAE